MKQSVLVLDEPSLEFRYRQQLVDPRDGLSLFGPCDTDEPSHPHSVTHGVIGTPEGIEAFSHWASAMNQAWLPPGKRNSPFASKSAPTSEVDQLAELEKQERLWPVFPGFEAAFCSTWHPLPLWKRQLSRESLSDGSRQQDQHHRVFETVNRYINEMRSLEEQDERPHVLVCVVPDEVWDNCRTVSRIMNPIGSSLSGAARKSRQRGQLDLFEEFDPEQYRFSVDFRRQLKARVMVMKHKIPIQIIRESTLRLSDENKFGERGLSPLSHRMWNLSTTLFYKAGGKPWRLATARDGVCYVGLAFRRTSPERHSKTACCAAQMFVNSGDGIVFLGREGALWSEEKHEYRLSESAAYELLKGTLETYSRLDGKPLTEVFIHSRSGVSAAEFRGYQRACPEGVKVVGVRVHPERFGPRLYRQGTRPVLRGTFWPFSNRRGYLFASGFKPRLGTYDGWEIPAPLRIDIQRGDADLELVARDILALTKLNYNACTLGDAQPVTVGFSDAVGEILVSNPTIAARANDIDHRFRFYI